MKLPHYFMLTIKNYTLILADAQWLTRGINVCYGQFSHFVALNQQCCHCNFHPLDYIHATVSIMDVTTSLPLKTNTIINLSDVSIKYLNLFDYIKLQTFYKWITSNLIMKH